MIQRINGFTLIFGLGVLASTIAFAQYGGGMNMGPWGGVLPRAQPTVTPTPAIDTNLIPTPTGTPAE